MKGFFKCLLFVPLFVVVFTGLFSVFSGSKAYASSDYDTTVKTTGNSPVVGPASSPTGVSTDYLSKMLDCTNWNNNPTEQNFCNSFVASWNNRTLDTGWSLVQYTHASGSTHQLTGTAKTMYADSYVIFSFSPTDDPYTFTDLYGGQHGLITSQGTYHIELGAVYDPGQADDGTLTATGNTSSAYLSTTYDDSLQFIFNNATVTYPPGFAGAVPPTSWSSPASVRPSYTYTVSKTGLMEVKYNNNVSPFLTGITTLNLDKMTDNWAGLDSTFSKVDYANPAGWLDISEQLPSSGYYMMRFTHNQQLDSPPWPVGANTRIVEADVQFHWDGSEVLNGTTDCAGSGICVTNGPSNTNGDFGGGVDIFGSGLTQAVTAPITALQTLITATCSPIVFPFGPSASFTVPCLSQFYSNVPALFNIWQVFITGGVMYLVVIKLMGRIRAYTNPLDDSIDVVQL